MTDSVSPIEFTLTDGGSAVNLTGADTVELFVSDGYTGEVIVSGVELVIDGTPTTGKVSWSPDAADVDTPGIYDCQFKVTWNDLTTDWFPSDSYLTLRLREDLEA
jgi:hypothetical protein